MGAATGPATPGSSDAPGDCTPRCRRPPRPRRTTRQQTTTEMSETSYGTAQAGAQTLAAGSLRDFRVPFEPETVSTLAMDNHRLIDQALKSAVLTANSRPWWRRPYRLMSMAATLLMGGTVGLFSWNAYQTGRQARNVFNPLPPLSKPRASTPAKSPTEALREAPAMIRSFYEPASGPYARQNSSNQMQRGYTRSAPNGNGQQFQVAQNTTAPGMPPAGAIAYDPALPAAATPASAPPVIPALNKNVQNEPA